MHYALQDGNKCQTRSEDGHSCYFKIVSKPLYNVLFQMTKVKIKIKLSMRLTKYQEMQT
jgi:hypothetical protein